MGYEAMGCHCSTHGECEAYEDDDGIIQCAKCRDARTSREEFKAKAKMDEIKARCKVKKVS